MAGAKNKVPKLGVVSLSSYIADLLLVGAGEEVATRHPGTRNAWHLFFFSFATLSVWHVFIRQCVSPENPGFYSSIRLIESVMYSELICALLYLSCRQYLFLLKLRYGFRFITILFLSMKDVRKRLKRTAFP